MNRSTISHVPSGTDPRPIKDKAYQRKCATEVIKFMISKGYDRQIQPKVLEAPSRRDVFGIVEFLFRMVDPTFTLDPGNTSAGPEEIVMMFKLVRYPFQFSPRSLASVGSPHTWPSLLAALFWLVELLRAQDASNPALAEQPSKDELMLRWLEASYDAFLSGDEAAEVEVSEELALHFDQSAEALRADAEALKSQLTEQSHKIASLKNRPDQLTDLRTVNEHLQKDKAKFETLCQEMDAYLGTVMKKHEERRKGLEEAEEALEQLQREVGELQDEVSRQSVPVEEAERMIREKIELNETRVTVNNEKEIVEKNVWNKELEVSKKLEEVEIKVKTYNETAAQLGLLKQSSDVDLSINFSTHSAPAEGKLSGRLHSHIKPELRKLVQSYKDKLAASQANVLMLESERSDNSERLADVKDQVESLDEKLKRADADFKREKERLQANIGALEADCQAIAQAEKELRYRATENLARTEREKEDLVQQCQNAEKEVAAEHEELCKSIFFSLNMIAQHKGYLRNTMQDLQQWLTEAKEEADKPIE